MSRVGKLPVSIPENVKLEIDAGRIQVEGPKGKLSQDYCPEVRFEQNDGRCSVVRTAETKRARAMHGLYRQLLFNMVHGVSQGFRKELQITGVGYRAERKGDAVVLNLGYSNPIEYRVPEGVEIVCETPNKVVVSGVDKQQVGQVASELRSLRPPEPYKGKGVKYADETVRRKVGKSGVK